MYQVITITEEGHFTYMLICDKITSSELVFMIGHRRYIGSFAPNILRRGTRKRFCSDVDGVPMEL